MLSLQPLAAQLFASRLARLLAVVLALALLATLAFAVLITTHAVGTPHLHPAVQSAHSALASGGIKPMGCANLSGPCE